jgi:hypothetical protein
VGRGWLKSLGFIGDKKFKTLLHLRNHSNVESCKLIAQMNRSTALTNLTLIRMAKDENDLVVFEGKMLLNV